MNISRSIAIVIAVIMILVSCQKEQQNLSPVQYVNLFIGNAGNGHTYPGACLNLR